MRRVLVIFMFVFFWGACSVTQKSRQIVIKITVTDMNKESLVDSARVMLTAITDSREVNEYVRFTDAYGQCTFSIDYNPLAQYQVRAMKKGLIGYYDSSYLDLDRSFSFLNEKTGNSKVLCLTSDTLNHQKFWASRTIRYDIDTLLILLKSNRYPLRSEFPMLLWEDIPDLLALGAQDIIINKYPVSVLSSSWQKDCYLGIVALWFIESIRISSCKNTMDPNEKFPSLTPVLHFSGTGIPEPEANSIEIMKTANQAYLKWWDKVKDLDKEQACRIDPFENTKLEW